MQPQVGSLLLPGLFLSPLTAKVKTHTVNHATTMFLPTIPLPKSSALKYSSITILQRLTLYSTNSNPSQPQPPQQPQKLNQLEESITNRPYWTRKIHQLCAFDRNVDQALRLLDHLRLHGYYPDSLNLSSIIHALCDSNRFSEARHRFLASLASSCIPDERTCNVLIARLLDSRTPRDTLHVFHRLVAAKPDFVPSLINFNRLIDQFCSFGRPVEAHKILFDMKNKGHCPNTVSYTTLIHGYCKTGDVGVAQKLFDEMLDCGVRHNSLTYSVFIRGVLRKRDVEHGKALMSKLWEVMRNEEDPSVNNVAFANLIDSLCREGFFREVFDIAEDMPQGKSVCDVFAYGQMIDSLCRFGRHHGASRIVYVMRKQGINPSLVSYNTIVHGLSKNGGYMRAYQLLEEGIEFGYSPSEFTYKVLIEGLCKESDLGKAKKLLDIMLNNKEPVDTSRIYNIYLGALRHMNNPTELLNVLVVMFQNQCQPDLITLNTVIHGFCKVGRVEEALKVVDDMRMGKFCAPDAVTFTTVISGLFNVGKTQEALDILRNVMPGNGFQPGVVTYNAVLRGLFKLNLGNEAMEMFNTMVSGGVIADSTTYAIIIDGLCMSNRIDDAKKFWDDIIWPSQIHDNFVYSVLVKGLCSSGQFIEACDFLYELVDCGVKPNIVSYNIVIEGACKLGLKKEAYQIVGEMRKNGLAPDAVTWRILDKLHRNAREQFCLVDATVQSKETLQGLNMLRRSHPGRQHYSVELSQFRGCWNDLES